MVKRTLIFTCSSLVHLRAVYRDGSGVLLLTVIERIVPGAKSSHHLKFALSFATLIFLGQRLTESEKTHSPYLVNPKDVKP